MADSTDVTMVDAPAGQPIVHGVSADTTAEFTMVEAQSAQPPVNSAPDNDSDATIDASAVPVRVGAPCTPPGFPSPSEGTNIFPPRLAPWSPFSSPGPSTGTLAVIANQQEIESERSAEDQQDVDLHHTHHDGQSIQSQHRQASQGGEDGEVAGPATNPAAATKRNTTQEARTKAERIMGEGAESHADGPCRACIKGRQNCVVNKKVSDGNTCARCARYKELCSHQQTAKGRQIKDEGQPRLQPCSSCLKKIQQGVPVLCYEAGPGLSRLGTACSQCLIDGTPDSCAANKNPRKSRGEKKKKAKARQGTAPS
ncbi:hypothetical protein V8F20_003959 [Naviculisporaceae sp. PSN 640]